MVKGNASVRNGLVVLLILAICLGISLVGKPSSLSQIVHEITSTSTSSVESPRVLLRNDKKNNSIVVVGKPSVPLQNQNEKADSFHFPSIQKHTAVEHLSGPITTRQYTAIWDLLPWEEASRNAQCVGPLTGGVSSLAIRDPAVGKPAVPVPLALAVVSPIMAYSLIVMETCLIVSQPQSKPIWLATMIMKPPRRHLRLETTIRTNHVMHVVSSTC
jgi:hypothetical protein